MATDPLSEAREALRQAQTDLYNANAYFGGAKLKPILARLDALPAPERNVSIGSIANLMGGGDGPVEGWFYPDAPEAA